MRNILSQSVEFKKVYEQGRRYDSVLMTAFVLRNDQAHHRLGITVSRKTALRAVDRNRAKRLLRETFRLHKPLIERLEGQYDWVLNGKRALVSSSVSKSLREFERVIAKVERDEERSGKSETRESSINSIS